ncbi:TerD family protein [Crassaminicella indica]|uniref:TerD family protein n=1 Tax=Crassaminicella indica TaxID=2855394 RepID=A0ABX8REI4_9CLOT|nr:TerD family protein [Crassaminicella indica]QXM06804.1 TerD family protein [Crassaminicella indica]
MAKSLIKGEKVIIGKVNEGLGVFSMELEFINTFYPLLDIDFFAFMIDEKQRVNKQHIIFYNQPMQNKSIKYYEDYKGDENKKIFEIDLNKLPKNIQKIVFGCSVYKDENIDKLKSIPLTFKMLDKITGIEMFQINEDLDIGYYETFLLGDIYQYKDLWKFNTVKYEHEKHILGILKRLYGINFY